MKKYHKIQITPDQQEILNKIGDKVKQLRKKNSDLNYIKFAEQNNLNHQTYYRLEVGENFTISTFLRVLEIHNVSIKNFFNDF